MVAVCLVAAGFFISGYKRLSEGHFVGFSQKIIELSIRIGCTLRSLALPIGCGGLPFRLRWADPSTPIVDFRDVGCGSWGLSLTNYNVGQSYDTVAKIAARRDRVHLGEHICGACAWHSTNWLSHERAGLGLFAMQNAVNCVFYKHSLILNRVCFVWRIWKCDVFLSCILLSREKTAIRIVPIEGEWSWVTMFAAFAELRYLWLTRLHNRLTILACWVQNRLTALLLMLVQRIERNLGCPGTAWRRRDPAESCCVELVEVVVIIVKLDSWCLRSVLCNVRHLLLFG